MTNEEIEAKLIELETALRILAESTAIIGEAAKTTQESFALLLDKLTESLKGK